MAARERLHALCSADVRPSIAVGATPESPHLRSDVTAPFAKRLAPLLRSQREVRGFEVSGVYPVGSGTLVDVAAVVPSAEDMLGERRMLVRQAIPGAAWQLLPGRILAHGDFDADGLVEPLSVACTPGALFNEQCTYSVWFATGEQRWNHPQAGNREAHVVALQGGHALALVPRDSGLNQAVGAEELTLVRFGHDGAHEAAATELATRLQESAARAACDPKAGGPVSFWRPRLAALGAGVPEIEPLAHALALPTPAGAFDDPAPATDPTDAEDPILQRYAPVARARCDQPSATRRQELTGHWQAAVRRHADGRFASLIRSTSITFGCGAPLTPTLVQYALSSNAEVAHSVAELWLVGEQQEPTLLAATESAPLGEWHHGRSLELGSGVDLDGDGASESPLFGTENEQGSLSIHLTVAVWSHDRLRPLRRSFEAARIVQLPDGAQALAIAPSPYPQSGWPPKLFRVNGGGDWIPVALPAAWTRETRVARAALAAP